MTTKYYGHDKQTDEWVEKTIQREILFCASSLVEDLFKAEIESPSTRTAQVRGFGAHPVPCTVRNGVYSYDEIENLYYPEDEDDPGYDEECAGDAREILEWWGVSDWLFDKLIELGECVYDAQQHNLKYWGRTCSGQAIALDPTFYDIKAIVDRNYAEVVAQTKKVHEDHAGKEVAK